MPTLSTTTRVQERANHAFAALAGLPPIRRLAESGALQKLLYSPTVQRLPHAVMSLPHINQIMEFRPIRLAEHYLEIMAAVAVPQDKKHKIVMVGLVGKGGRFHLLRRAPNDRFEAGRLNNVTGHVANGDTFEQTVHREMMEETRIPSESMIREHAATLNDLGHFGWLMHLRTPDGIEPSIVYGKMYLFTAPEIEAHHIKWDPIEHSGVVALEQSEVARNRGELAVFDRFFFNANLPKLGRMQLRP